MRVAQPHGLGGFSSSLAAKRHAEGQHEAGDVRHLSLVQTGSTRTTDLLIRRPSASSIPLEHECSVRVTPALVGDPSSAQGGTFGSGESSARMISLIVPIA
jgi:hypothetical protein